MGRTSELFFLSPLLALFLTAGTASAEVLSGYVELYRQTGDTKTTDATGLSTQEKTTMYLQRYNLSFYNAIYPFVTLRAGLRAEVQDLDVREQGNDSSLTSVLLMPSAGLMFRNPFVYAGVGYDKREEKVTSAGTSETDIRITKSGLIGFRPEGLPSLDVQVVKQNTYDEQHRLRDREEKSLSLTSTYNPVRSVQLDYRALFTDSEDRILARETEGLTQSGRAAYGDSFFDGRAMLSATYNINRADLDTVKGAAGTSRLQLFPVAGLSAINDTPLIGALDVNGAMIDGNLTASTGINIGLLPSLGGDTKKRNIGIDFGIAADVSTLFVIVDRSLPDTVAGSFVWDIYTSQDNQNWILYQPSLSGVFDPFENRFEISFPAVRTRYIKAVTRPLPVAVAVPPGVDVNNIFITELQAFLDSSTGGAGSAVTLEAEYEDVNGRVYLIRDPRNSLFYDIYYQNRTARVSDRSVRSDVLINSLIGYSQFSRVFTGTAKIMRENDGNADGTTVRYNDYEGTLLASVNSLPKLHHSMTATVKTEEWSLNDAVKDSFIFYVSNEAEFYPGINALLSGGKVLASAATYTTVSRTDNTTFDVGTSIVPHRTVQINLNYNWTASEQDANQPGMIAAGATEVRIRTLSMNASYNPVSTLYLYGSILNYEQTGQPERTVRSLSGSWTFQQSGGALEIRFIYTEDVESDTQTRNRLVGPYVRWRINPRMFLDTSYMIATTDCPSQQTETDSLTSSFKMYF